MGGIRIEEAGRLKELPPYLFAEIDRLRREAERRGVDIISLGIGDPDLPTHPHIVECMARAVRNSAHHQYPSYEGALSFREAVAHWYRERFGVALDPEKEVISLIGSKEGIAHIPLAFVNPGDAVLIPDPGYPVYKAGTVFAGGEPVELPLKGENGFLPDLSAVSREDARRAVMMFLNYPNNPTSAVATREVFKEAVEFAAKNNVIVCHDAAYSEIAFDGHKPMSFMEVDGAREVGVEFHSLSKTFNMTGWRVGCVVGNREVIAGLGKIKTNVDSGVFGAVQEAAVAALTGDMKGVEENNRIYTRRRDILVEGLNRIGLNVEKPKATFYVWAPVPAGYDSKGFAAHLLTNAGVVCTPGVGFGLHGEGYVRMTLCTSEERLREVVERLARLEF